MATLKQIKIGNLDLLGVGEACALLNIQRNRLNILVKKYEIPHKELDCGKVFLKKDLDAFQKARVGRLKRGRE